MHALRSNLIHLFSAWLDAPTSLSTAIFLALFVILWTLFQVVSYASIDLHPDLLEFYAWGRHPSLGYYKHPPLGALMTTAWFSVFPARDWSFQLLAMVNAAVGLYATDLIARRYLTGDKRSVVMLLLLLTPFYQFHAERFGANQTLLSTWPVATYCFLRSCDSRGWGWAIAAGGTAALAMLGKYYSIFLVLGLVAAALTRHDRAAYLRSASPWISTLAGLLVLAPHFWWLTETDFPPFHYALSNHSAASIGAAMLQAIEYCLGAVGYVVPLLIVYLLAARPSVKSVMEAFWPSNPDVRVLAVLFWVPILSPIPVALTTGELLTSLWTMSGWFLLPILLLAPSDVVLRRSSTVAIAALVTSITLGSIATSPAIALIRFVSGTDAPRTYFRLLAEEARTRLQASFGRSLTIVLGDPDLTVASTFYAAGHPDALPGFNPKSAPWITPSRLASEGWVALCATQDTVCLSLARQAAGQRSDLVWDKLQLTAHFLGLAERSPSFTLLMVPPTQK